VVHRLIFRNSSAIVAQIGFGPRVSAKYESVIFVDALADHRPPVLAVTILHVRGGIDCKYRGKDSRGEYPKSSNHSLTSRGLRPN
jgi:hypothetical protein